MTQPVDPSLSTLTAHGLKLALFHSRVFSIYSHLTKRERVVLYSLSKDCAARGPICEIGSYLGASACALAAGVVDGGVRNPVVCVDTWQNEGMSEGARDTWTTFASNTAPYSDVVRPIRGRSYEVAIEADAAAGAPCEMIFFDGDHSDEGIQRDWEAYRPRLAPGAIVVFHDIGWAEGVQRILSRTVKAEVAWSRQLPNLFWGGLR